jgi:hypothetical protein
MKGRLDHLHIRQVVRLLVGFVVLGSLAAFSYGVVVVVLVVKEVVMNVALPLPNVLVHIHHLHRPPLAPLTVHLPHPFAFLVQLVQD